MGGRKLEPAVIPLAKQRIRPYSALCLTRGASVSSVDVNILRESLDLVILRALTWGPRHGYAIAEWLEGATGALLFLDEGTLYPALHRLARRKLVDSTWGIS